MSPGAYLGPRDKWLRLLVTGDNVKPRRAAEIILRTIQPEYLETNDRHWKWLVAKTLELDRIGDITPESADAYRERVGGIELEYLHCTDRIASNDLVGPHGWIDWDGFVGCGSYNLGKYPPLDAITADLTKIAVAFPDLVLYVQALEAEGRGPVCGEWSVREGCVERHDPPNQRLVTARVEIDGFETIKKMADPLSQHERGVDLKRLRTAYKRLLDARQASV